MYEDGTRSPDKAARAVFYCPDCDEEVEGWEEIFFHGRVAEQRHYHYLPGEPVRTHQTELEPVEEDPDALYDAWRDEQMLQERERGDLAPRFSTSGPSTFETDPLYRSGMRDAGRGGLLR